MRTETTELFVVLRAEGGNVLCDGNDKTSVNGRVTAPIGSDLSAWVEMPEAEADALIAASVANEELTDEEFTNMVEEVL